ncbi:MAG: sterol desaturase family protein [Acidiferrobacterales bacterium]
MAEHNRRFFPWVAYPGTMVLAFVGHAALLYVGLPVIASAYVAVVFGAALVTLFEFVIPYDRTWQPKKEDVKNDLLFMVTVQMVLPPVLTLFFGVTLLRYLQTLHLPVTQLWPHDLPIVLQVVLMLLVAEFFRYWLHVAAHNTKLLWWFHSVHHSVHKLYWLNVGRFHPFEKAVQYLVDALPFIVVGVSEEVLAGYLIFYAVNGFFQHSNVDARYGILNYVVSGAELHRWHHSKLTEESNHNYGNNLIVWDLVFGSWFLPTDRRVGDLGLYNRQYPLDFLSQMATPFTPGLDKQDASAGNN